MDPEILLIPLLFVAFWFFVCFLVSWVAGHMALLARFPPVSETLEQSFSFASGYMRFNARFRNALFVGIGSRGLHMAPNGLFRPPFYRGIPCIPWHQIKCVRPQSGGLGDWFLGSKFEIASVDFRFSLHGKPGLAVEQKLAPSRSQVSGA